MKNEETIEKIKITFYIVLTTIFLIFLSGFMTRETKTVELYTHNNETGGGGAVAFVDVKEGFPVNYVDNPQADPSYSPSWGRFALNSAFWLVLTTSLFALGQRKIK